MSEIDALDPLPENVTLSTGLVVRIEPLRSRQFFKLLRIITHSALPGLRDSGIFDTDGLDAEEFTARLLSVVLMSIPDAEDQTIEFVRSMCAPVGLIERKGLNKQDTERNAALWDALDDELDNPQLDDLVTILEAVVKREASDMMALGKRLAGMFKLAQKTGQIPSASPDPKESTLNSSEESPAPTTLSRRSTSGRTRSSATSRSDGSDSASPGSESDSTTPVGSGVSG